MSSADIIPREVISTKEAQKLLGKTNTVITDKQLEDLVRILDLIARETIIQAVSLD